MTVNLVVAARIRMDYMLMILTKKSKHITKPTISFGHFTMAKEAVGHYVEVIASWIMC